MVKLEEGFILEVLSVVEEIPVGTVATYGTIATLMGYPKNARLVGRVMGLSSYYGKYPCHRVVNHQGRLVPGWLEQKTFLEKEGNTFLPNGCVNLKKHQWQGVPVNNF